MGRTVTATLTPAEFVAAHPDPRTWTAVDHEVYEHLTEVADRPDAPQPAAADDDDIVWGR